MERGSGLLAGALAGIALAATGSAQVATAELHWRHASTAESWIPDTVSIGADGEQVFTAYRRATGGVARLFSSFDQDPPAPLVSDATGAADYHRVASAEHADLHAVLYLENGATAGTFHPVLEAYRAGTSGPLWTYSFPVTLYAPRYGVQVSADGSRIVAWVYASPSTHLVVLGPQGPASAATYLVDTVGNPVHDALSDDGSTLALASEYRTTLVDVATGAVLQRVGSSGGHLWAHDLSGDGSLVVRGQGSYRVDVYQRGTGGWTPWFQHQEADVVARTAIAPDGSTLAIAYNLGSGYQQVRLQLFDLTAPGQPVVLDQTLTGQGSLFNGVEAMDFSSDGGRVALGLLGDEMGVLPELLVYGVHAGSWDLVASRDLPGSVKALALSPDGMRIAVARKDTHVGLFGSTGSVELYDLDTDLRLIGTPRASDAQQTRQVTFELRTPPGRSAFLFWSPTLADTPELMGRMGLLYLLRSAILPPVPMTANATGDLHTVQFPMPLQPGTVLHFQALSGSPRALSNNPVTVTVLP